MGSGLTEGSSSPCALGLLTEPSSPGCALAPKDQVPREAAVIAARHVRLRVVMLAVAVRMRRVYLEGSIRSKNLRRRGHVECRLYCARRDLLV